MNESFIQDTRMDFRTKMKEAGLSDTFINEFATGALRDNYGQTPDAHAFVGRYFLVHTL